MRRPSSTTPATVRKDYHELMNLAGYQAVVDKAADTALKINISWHFFFPGSSTTPWQLDGVIHAMLEDGYEKREVPLPAVIAVIVAIVGWIMLGVIESMIDRVGGDGHPVHHTLLGAGVRILESIDLSAVGAGEYTLICLPLWAAFRGLARQPSA